MNATGVVRQLIVDDSTANALLSGRIYTGRVSVDTGYPCAVIQLASTRPNPTKTGASEVDFCRVQVDIYGSTAASADAVSSAIRAAIDYISEQTVTVSGTSVHVGRIDFENEYGDFEDAPGIYRKITEYMVYAKV